jgi:cysteine desulfurase/selenocysteine lyase
VETVRAQFPILNQRVNGKPLVYLDNGATSQKPQAVLDALDRYWKFSNANIHRGVHTLSQRATAHFDDARDILCQFLNARESAEIIFTKGCTEAINLVAHGLARNGTLGEGDEILLSTMEHHSNIVPWQLQSEWTGSKVVPIPITDEGEIDLEAYAQQLRSGKVKVVGIVHISNALGTINPVETMVQMAHDVGALVLIDGAQAGPHHLIDVQAIDADFYTLSCHKMYAPTGVGVLYGKRSLLKALPPYHGGGDMIRTVDFSGSTFADIPAKFEAGTPNVASVIGLGAALQWLLSLTENEPVEEGSLPRARLRPSMEAIDAHERSLSQYAERELGEVPGVRIVGTAAKKAGIVSFVMDSAHPHDIGTILDEQGVAIRAGHHCCMPLMKRLGIAATARASFACYNDEGDVDRLIQGVLKVKEIFG